ncbi:uncharacterized protein MELLADRAFT_107064 [Melampsora larici-populina 98AG31]|uniref:Uncharacterized protein n=1 Tax=Melampsora larici-populina (strain 98AG31 / pathotype 3-4-7) TaxID=747676 RepID=F4RNJ6_MELLP|nr:uncharacterized protein MELLADRAFT_107064 [Melampsora larici-populina 98AG31]EGG06085.1 hypothetical protein MELLADRAFT_107064 [Melampsora larici-populina 98AG31]
MILRRSTECWMTALRYDILVCSQIFIKCDSKTLMKDIGTRVLQYENQAKDKSLRSSKANYGDVNSYARGGRWESKDPETGLYTHQAPQQSNSGGSHTGHSSESHLLKRKRSRHGGHNAPQHNMPSQVPPQTAPQPVQHDLPLNPTLYQVQQPAPIATPMAANRFPSRGGRGGWQGGRGSFQNLRNNT